MEENDKKYLEENVVTHYLGDHIDDGISLSNFNKILDLIDEYIELKEATLKEEKAQVRVLTKNKRK